MHGETPSDPKTPQRDLWRPKTEAVSLVKKPTVALWRLFESNRPSERLAVQRSEAKKDSHKVGIARLGIPTQSSHQGLYENMTHRQKLTAKQERFVSEYMGNGNHGTKAALAAGYSPQSAETQASQLLKKTQVRAEVAKRQAVIAERANVDAEYVLTQAVKLHERCMEEPFDAAGALRALELIGKHVNVQAFRQKVEPKGEDGSSIPSAMLQFIWKSVHEEKKANQREGTIYQ